MGQIYLVANWVPLQIKQVLQRAKEVFFFNILGPPSFSGIESQVKKFPNAVPEWLGKSICVLLMKFVA